MSTKLNYTSLKEIAKASKVPVSALLALSPGNDPFYVGTPTDLAQGQWFAEVWKRTGFTRSHLRGIHYWIVVQSPAVIMPDGQPYLNTEKCWQFLNIASKKARYLGLVELQVIADHKHPAPHVHAYYHNERPGYQISLPDPADPYIRINGIDHVNAQPYHLEIWCEKSTMNDVLDPIASRYHANLCTFVGEVSTTSTYELIQRIRNSGGKPTRIFYISDFDPAGNSMPVAMSRKLEFMLRYFGFKYDVQVRPIALTADQVAEYDLPRVPIKETEKRAARFESNFGEGAVELDALEAIHPGVLEDLVTDNLEAYYSHKAEQEAQEKADALKEAVQEQIRAIAGRYGESLENLQAMFDEIRAIRVTGDYGLKRYGPLEDEAGHALFDSGRSYLDQLKAYYNHKSGNGHETD